MRDVPARQCRHCGQPILCDLFRGWVSQHHQQRYGYSVLWTTVMWRRCHRGNEKFTTRHEPLPPMTEEAVRVWLDA